MGTIRENINTMIANAIKIPKREESHIGTPIRLVSLTKG
ncbi:hypothetical protein DESAMIL20_1692 [Desulfurella amilsii]|uniref:Uncharacterized protein n=1 Tax=Desulfurella amilsii TaxID=1562698 RepID=A0A1X4XX75_9BACT|nr:hypothetical protein DESAMIL20_1692 [Desulfurella amilsii]